MPARAFRDILAELAARSDTTRDKGTRFELLTQAFFQTDALYTSLFTKVWRWSEWPGSQGRSETGIDLVAQNADDEKYTAIQCKFYAPQNTIAKPDIDSFLSASGTTEFTKRIIVSTTEKWNRNAEETIEGQQIPVSRIGVPDFEKSSINWDTFDLDTPEDMTRVQQKRPREDQLEAIDAVLDGFKQHDRGKLIMACGTGKTYTALRIAEEQVPPGGTILFLAPSITLVSQSVREWGNDASVSLRIHAVCSDPKAGQRQKSNDEDTNEIAPYDLVSPATTSADTLVANVRNSRTDRNRTVIFSTYQSLDVIIAAQALGLGRIDLIICDEAHRTTGVTLVEGEESQFTKVHDDRHIEAAKRLYMTATPRIFDERSRTKAGEVNATLASMDDESIYGPEFYRLSFADAVEKDLLCDYRVLIFGVNEAAVARNVQGMMAGDDNSLTLNDAAKIVASWNAISKQQSAYEDFGDDPAPMRRVVAFANRICQSKTFSKTFNGTVQEYAENSRGGYPDIKCVSEHVDGRQNALVRGNKLEWLRGGSETEECHILSNARCLTEGVDVPALDAVLFLSPRSSQIDVVQAVGRAMRQAPGTDKKYGYIIIPIAVTPEGDYLKTIRDSKYNATWQVLQALKSHDEDFYDTINQADLKQNKKISVVIFDDKPGPQAVPREETPPYSADVQIPLPTDAAEEIREAVYARIVDSLTDKHYYRRWAEEVERINRQYETRIRELLAADDPPLQAAFAAFLGSLQRDLNDGITRDHAVSMLAQHLITKPVFDALFAEYEFTTENPVSQAMERMTCRLELDHGTGAETKELAGFYKSVQRRIHYVEKAEDKQRIIADLYEDFFKLAIPKTAASLGIVYTPVEAVDFILRSVEDVLQEEFGKSLTDAGIHILDPFTGTGTFIQRLLASGLIKPHDLARKYTQELHANEMVLLAYYIAAINIETTYHDRAEATTYTPFEGIVLTDTFESREYHQTPHLSADFTPTNNARLEHQKQQDIRVIVGNPPWSVGQRSQDDDNRNRVYKALRQRLIDSYAKRSIAKNRRNLYDTYIQGIRWASDRIQDSKHGGIIAFITNGGFVASDSADGLRKTLASEFDTIYCLNLRGEARGSGDTRQREAGNVFGSGSRTGVAILILVKKPAPATPGPPRPSTRQSEHTVPLRSGGTIGGPDATIHYHEVADYQDRDQKLALLAANRKRSIPWLTVTPDKYGDWINQRSDDFQKLFPLYGDGGILILSTPGITTARDAWCYNFSRSKVLNNTGAMIDFFNGQGNTDNPLRDPTKFSWSRRALRLARAGTHLEHDTGRIVPGAHRPFCKQNAYFQRNVNEEVYQQGQIYPSSQMANLGIAVSNRDKNQLISCLMTNALIDFHTISDTTQYLARWTYQDSLPLGGESAVQYERVSNINTTALAKFRQHYADDAISEDDLFYYVYGVLHHQGYRTKYANDLKKEAARIPLAADRADFHTFAEAGRQLADLHVNYEQVEPFPLTETYTDRWQPFAPDAYRVRKMRYGGRARNKDLTTIIYNDGITLTDIPDKAHEYRLGSRSALDWLIDRYQVKTDKASGIVNDPNDWADEHDDPRYILDLVKRITTVSVRTVDIVASLPDLPGIP